MNPFFTDQNQEPKVEGRILWLDIKMKSRKLGGMANCEEWLALAGAIQAAPSGMMQWVLRFGNDMLDQGVSKITYGNKM